jgi:hypothetical protein
MFGFFDTCPSDTTALRMAQAPRAGVGQTQTVVDPEEPHPKSCCSSHTGRSSLDSQQQKLGSGLLGPAGAAWRAVRKALTAVLDRVLHFP